jgi:DNA-binding HxlR family transcriptional regulator
MQRTSFENMACSIARTLEQVGEWWTPLILRDVYLGLRRFDEIQRDLELSRKVLASRLDALVDNGLLERRRYQRRPKRHEYVLTEKGLELVPVLMALTAWGDRWTAGEAGPPTRMRHDTCGKWTTPTVTCSQCGEQLRAEDVTVAPGPGSRVGPGTRVLGASLSA